MRSYFKIARIKKLYLILTVTIPLLQNSAAAGASKTSEIELSSALLSPDGRYQIINDHLTHSLRLRNSTEKASKQFYSYERIADVLWSPDSKHFALNDDMGSNVSNALLFNVHGLSKPVNLGDKLYHSPKSSRNIHSITGNDHIYYNVRKWVSPTKLEMVVTGYGNKVNRNGFALIYVYDDLKGSFRCIKGFERYRNDLLY